MKKFISIILTTAVILTATACGGGTNSNNDTSTDTTNTTDSSDTVDSSDNTNSTNTDLTLNTVSMFGGTDPTAEYYQKIISDYEGKYNVKVDDISSTADETWKTSVVADFQVGNEPDVLFFFTGVDAEPIIETGKVVDIDTIRAEYPDYGSNLNQSAMEFMVEPDGNTYALPVRGFWEGLFINEDLFEEYNLELPTTWENFETAIKTFASNGIIPIAVSFADVPHYWIEHLILATGGIEEHKKTLAPDEAVPDSWIEGLDLLTELNNMGAFSPDATATSNDATSQLFRDKKAAMMIDGSWFAGGVTDQENTTVIAFPSYTTNQKDPTSIIGGFSTGFYITTSAWENPEKREAAVNFVMEMTSNYAISEFAKVGGAPAADVEIPDGLSPLQSAGVKFSGEAKAIDMPIDSRLNKQSWDHIISNISNIVDGSTNAEEVLTQAALFNK